MGSDGYLCGPAGYTATVKGYDFWGIVNFTYRETFVVDVCSGMIP
jgi:hypothetical protein